MHSLAIALKNMGHSVTGSDDEIFDPAKTQLAKADLLPATAGWFPEKINGSLDAVILGMHAHRDNPELQRALDLGVRVFSYPEYLYQETINKIRVVIAGSHGKTTITSMIMHALRINGVAFDYMAGSRVEGFENMLALSPQSGIAVFEGDEYLASCLDPRPKFHLYQPHIALISGIAWDHVNVFPTWEDYIRQFSLFISKLQSGSSLVFCTDDSELRRIVDDCRDDLRLFPYSTPAYSVEEGVSVIRHGDQDYRLRVFGRHNLQNLEGARRVCQLLGLTDEQFFQSIVSFGGAGKRLQMLGKTEHNRIFLDFAHSPSKVRATVDAVREQFSSYRIMACLELHTYSSLSRGFLEQYRGTLGKADEAVVFYNPQTIVHKRLASISPDDVKQAFDKEGMSVFTDKVSLESYLMSSGNEKKVFLFMSSGNFSGINFHELSDQLLRRIV